MAPPTIYFIRHGQTDWNVARRLQGHRDIPLNDTGRSQAARNGRTLRRLLGSAPNGLVFLSSPLKRARETMEIVRGELGLPPRGYDTEPRLREISFGAFEGHSWSELMVRQGALVAARNRDPWRFRPQGGESYVELYDRVAAWLEDLSSHGTPAVVVSHGGVCRCLQGLIGGHPPAEIPALEAPQDQIMVIHDSEIHWR